MTCEPVSLLLVTVVHDNVDASIWEGMKDSKESLTVNSDPW